MSNLLRICILDTCPNKSFVKEYYESKIKNTSYEGDCGIDIIFPDDVCFIVDCVTFCHMGISCEFVNSLGKSSSFDLVARSSISKTPLILTNSIGIIDAGYRGEIIAAFRCFKDCSHSSTIDNGEFTSKMGDRYCQIVAPDRQPIKIELVDSLSTTQRGIKGFGSTN